MRPTPTRLPDDLLASACATLGIDSLDKVLANPPLLAAVNAVARARLNPNPRVRPSAPRARAAAPMPVPRKAVASTKCLAANDIDHED